MKPVLISMLVTLGMGCTIGGESEPPLSYEEFQATFISTYVDDEGNEGIFYDDEQPLASMDQVAKLYEIYVAAKTTGERIDEATANTTVSGKITKWDAATAKNLTYCVSNKFGDDKAKIVNAVKDAGAAWTSATNGTVKFVYVPEHDEKCNTKAPVVFDVNPSKNIGGAAAKAFFPDEPRNKRRVLVNLDEFFSAGVPYTGIMRHELGHSLGLRHETARKEAIKKYGKHCFEDIYYKTLTAYDDKSVMTTPYCMGDDLKNTSLTLTAKDKEGIRKLYP
jgi:hypothetical protein